MTINMLLMIFTFAIGQPTGQSIERNSATFQANPPGPIESNCWRNGHWTTPCPPDQPPPPPPEVLVLH